MRPPLRARGVPGREHPDADHADAVEAPPAQP